MDGLMIIFMVVFVLALAAVCALLALRMLGSLELPESPPFPRRRHPVHRHARAADAHSPVRESEELVSKS